MQRVSGAGLAMVGVSHHSTALADRERLLACARRVASADAPRTTSDSGESMLLATCNRVELYLASDDIEQAVAKARVALGEQSIVKTAYDATRHLARVAAGLESVVLGEHQIAGQVRRAWLDARSAGRARLLIGELAAGALRAAGRVRAETALGRGGISVAGTALDLAEQRGVDPRRAAALIVGAGPVGRELAVRWSRRCGRPAVIASRSFTHATAAALASRGEAIALDDLPAAMTAADVMFVAIRTPQWIFSRHVVAAAVATRRHRPLLLMDLSVPRAIEPAAAAVNGVGLHTVDDLAAVRSAATDRRTESVPAATAIVDDEAERTYARLMGRATRAA